MEKIVGTVSAELLKKNSVVLVKIPDNPDNLSVIVYQKDNQIHAWLNCCPHEGRKLCNDTDYLLNRKNNFLECMHHQALFHPITGECEIGSCKYQSNIGVSVQVSFRCHATPPLLPKEETKETERKVALLFL